MNVRYSWQNKKRTVMETETVANYTWHMCMYECAFEAIRNSCHCIDTSLLTCTHG